MPVLRCGGQGDVQKIFKSNRDYSLLLSVPGAERLGETLDLNASHYELINGDVLPMHRVVFHDQELDELWRKAESHLGQGWK